MIYIVHPSKECPSAFSALSKTVLRNTDFKATLRTLQIPGKGIKVIGKLQTLQGRSFGFFEVELS